MHISSFSRENPNRFNASTGSSIASSHNYSPLSVSPHLSPRGGNLPSPQSYSPGGSALTPYYSSPLTPLDDNYFEIADGNRRQKQQNGNLDVHVTKQVRKHKKCAKIFRIAYFIYYTTFTDQT